MQIGSFTAGNLNEEQNMRRPPFIAWFLPVYLHALNMLTVGVMATVDDPKLKLDMWSIDTGMQLIPLVIRILVHVAYPRYPIREVEVTILEPPDSYNGLS